MNDFLQFLTSKEIIVVYIVGFFACFLCFIIYLVEKNNVKLKQRHNTRELNKLVEEIKDEIQEEDNTMYVEPVLETLPSVSEESSVMEMLSLSEEKEEKEESNLGEKLVIEEMDIVTEVGEEEPVVSRIPDEFEYTSIEPDQETAQLELKKLTEELEKEEEVDYNSKLTSYEEMQEETAIISLEELIKKSKEMYEKNEITQYEDDGTEPISLKELEERVGTKAVEYFEEPFIIENVVPKEEVLETKEEKVDAVSSKFKSSPIISPIYGIEKPESPNELELENTANYEKLDAEIKRTNEFLMTLKELQSKLDR